MALTPTQLLILRQKAENSWLGTANDNSQMPYSETAKAILENQTATFKLLDNWEKDNKIAVTFMKMCDIVTEDCEDNCDITENGLSTGMKNLDIDVCQKVGFSINENDVRSNDYAMDDLFNKGMTNAINQLDEFWSVQSLAKLKTFAGQNVAPQPYTFNQANKTTNVPSADYNVNLVAQLINQAFLNKMGDAYFVDNGSLWASFFMAQMNAGNLDGKGQMNLVNQVKMYFDQFNFAKAGLTEDTFSISKGAVAMKTVNKYSDKPRVLTANGQTRFTVKSKNLPNVKYDAIYQEKCVGDDIVHTWRFITNGGIWLNPEACPITIDIAGTPTAVTQTGVLSYSKA